MNIPKKRIKLSLFFKFGAFISLSLIIVMIGLGLFLISFLKDSLLEEKYKNNQMLTDSLARMISGPIQRKSYYTLEENAFKLQTGKHLKTEILSVIIYDNNNVKLNPNGIEHELIETPRKYWDIKKSLIFTKDRELLGKVVIVFSLESIYEKTNNMRHILTITIVSTIATLVIIILILSIFIITKPLTQLIKATEDLSKGNFDVNIKSYSNDEIGVLKSYFLYMSKELKNSFEKIQDYSEHLEEMVEKRTNELNKANKKLMEEEEALIQFTTQLNEQTMAVGKIEKELEKKTMLLEEANAKLKKMNEDLLDELKMAKRVQESIIPDERKYPAGNELSLGSTYASMESIGGDLFDIIKINESKYAFLMADVSGHGIPAALITTMAKVSFTSHSKKDLPTNEVCKRVNEDMLMLIGDLAYFLTAYYGVLDLETGQFEYSNAGHHPAIHFSKKSKELKKLDTDGNLIGAFPFELEFDLNKTTLQEGDRILMFTDGIIEAKNDDNQFYGYPKLLEYIDSSSYLSPKEFVDGLIKDVDDFCNKRPPDDDRAVLYIEFNSKISSDKSVGESINVEGRKIVKED
jgi:serine phosphatase RsbU (regulator of sigma subunit)